MAIIGKIRQRSWILVGFIAAALLIFIVQAAFDNGGSLFGGSGEEQSIGKIGGSSVSVKEYSDGIENYEKGVESITDRQITPEQKAQIQEEVWNTLASRRLLKDAYTDLGLNVSEGEMGDLMWGQMPHPFAQRFIMKARQVKPDVVNEQTGQIDQARMRDFVTQIDNIDKQNKTNFREMLGYVESLIQDEQVKQKYASLVSQSFYMPTFMAKEVVNSGRGAKTAIVAVPYASLPDDKYTVTDEEITSYLKENKSKYEKEASRVVDIVVFDVNPSAEDTAQTLEKINTMRTEYLASLPKDSAFIARNSSQGNNVDFFSREDVLQTKRNVDTLFSLPVGTLTNVYRESSFYLFTKIIDRKVAPDTVRAAQIVLSAGSGTPDEMKAANATADSLIRVIASGAKPFGQVASENSIDPNSKAKGGDLGYFTRRTVLPREVDDKVFFGMSPNQIAKVEYQNYIFIMLMIDAKSPKVLTKFADFVVELVPSNETEKVAYDKAVAFQQKNQTAAAFDKAAKNETAYKNVVLTQNMSFVSQVGEARKLVQWAFQQEKPDVIKDIDIDSKFMVVKLNKIMPKGLPKAEDVREEISLLIRNEKKGKDLVEQLNKAAAGTTDLNVIAAKVKDAMVVDTALVRFSSAYAQSLGNEPKLVGTVFGVPVGKISKAVAGERAAFIVQPKSIDENAPEMGGDINMYKQMMQRQFISRLNFQVIFESIKKKAKVEDTRFKFY